MPLAVIIGSYSLPTLEEPEDVEKNKISLKKEKIEIINKDIITKIYEKSGHLLKNLFSYDPHKKEIYTIDSSNENGPVQVRLPITRSPPTNDIKNESLVRENARKNLKFYLGKNIFGDNFSERSNNDLTFSQII